jgi:hypothetical protein
MKYYTAWWSCHHWLGAKVQLERRAEAHLLFPSSQFS